MREFKEEIQDLEINKNSVHLDQKSTEMLASEIIPKMENDFEKKCDRHGLDNPEEVAEVTNYITGATIYGNSNLADRLHRILCSHKGRVDTNKKAQSSFSGKCLEGVKWRGRDIYFSGHFGKRKTISFFVRGNL